MKKVASIFMTLVWPVLGYAAIETEMLKFLNQMNSSINTSSAEIYKGQKAGYATGGSVVIRNRANQTQPVGITMPHFDAGCGGIDIFTGGLSFIDGEEIIKTLKSIGSNSMGYAFLLGLETVSPITADVMKQLQSWANQANGYNINSCEVASQLVGSAWPKKSLASQHICRAIASQNGSFRDHVASRHSCSTTGGLQNSFNMAQKDNPDLLITDYNVAWEAIKRQGPLGNDKSAAELLMTMMGTIVVTSDAIKIYPAKAQDESFLEALLEGGNTSVYKCDLVSEDNKCIRIMDAIEDVPLRSAFKGRIGSLLWSIQDKILSDEELNKEEQELLAKTSIPIYKFVGLMMAYKGGICPCDLIQLADIVAMDMLLQYLRGSLDDIRRYCHLLRRHALYSDTIDDYVHSLSDIERSITYYENRISYRMTQETNIFQKMEVIQKQIAAELCL